MSSTVLEMLELIRAHVLLRELRTRRFLEGGVELADKRHVDEAVTAFRYRLPVYELERSYRAVSVTTWDTVAGCGLFDREALN